MTCRSEEIEEYSIENGTPPQIAKAAKSFVDALPAELDAIISWVIPHANSVTIEFGDDDGSLIVTVDHEGISAGWDIGPEEYNEDFDWQAWQGIPERVLELIRMRLPQ